MGSRIIRCLLVSAILLGCQPKAIYLSTETSFTDTTGAGFRANTNYTYFNSSAVGSQTEATFSNDDGDYVKFKLISVSPANLDIANIQGVEIHFVAAPSAAITATAGFLNITGSAGSGGNVTSFAGSFQFNLTSTDTSGVGPPTEPGTIKGVFNFVKSQ